MHQGTFDGNFLDSYASSSRSDNICAYFEVYLYILRSKNLTCSRATDEEDSRGRASAQIHKPLWVPQKGHEFIHFSLDIVYASNVSESQASFGLIHPLQLCALEQPGQQTGSKSARHKLWMSSEFYPVLLSLVSELIMMNHQLWAA